MIEKQLYGGGVSSYTYFKSSLLEAPRHVYGDKKRKRMLEWRIRGERERE